MTVTIRWITHHVGGSSPGSRSGVTGSGANGGRAVRWAGDTLGAGCGSGLLCNGSGGSAVEVVGWVDGNWSGGTALGVFACVGPVTEGASGPIGVTGSTAVGVGFM